MRIDLRDPLATPVVPAGIELRAFDLERDARVIHATLTEAFTDHWGFSLPSFDRLVHEYLEGTSSGFDAGLWFVAVEGDEVVGAVCGRERLALAPDTGHVEVLGVRDGWRGHGFGRALLFTAFGELKRRGVAKAELGVDAESETGATRLYQGVGMRTFRAAEFWEKALPPDPGRR